MKNFLQLFTIGGAFLLFLGVGEAWGTVVPHTFSGTSGDIDSNISFTSEKNNSSTAPAYNADGTLRLYYHSSGNGGSITLLTANGAVITDVTITAYNTSYTPTMKYNVDGGADATASLTGTTYTISGISAGTSLKIRNANTTNTQLRITSIEVTYTPPACTDPELSFSTTGTIYKEADAANFTNAASSSSTGTITYSSSKPSVATVNSSTGEVTIAGEGITVITAAQDPDLAYCADETSYTLVVGEEFQPVTQNSQLIADGEYIIVGKNTTTNAYYALGYQKYSTGQIPAPTNREAAAVDVSELIPVAQTASSEADGCAYKLKLGGSTGAWTIKDIANDAYIGPASGDASDNHLKISTSETVPTWTIVVAGDSKVTITCVGAQANTNGSGRNTILFNQSNNPALFACYASTTSITPGDLYLYATPETIDNAPSSIAPVKATDAVVSSKYYNLQGQEIGTPQSGAMYIVRKVHASGKVSAAKELKR